MGNSTKSPPTHPPTHPITKGQSTEYLDALFFTVVIVQFECRRSKKHRTQDNPTVLFATGWQHHRPRREVMPLFRPTLYRRKKRREDTAGFLRALRLFLATARRKGFILYLVPYISRVRRQKALLLAFCFRVRLRGMGRVTDGGRGGDTTADSPRLCWICASGILGLR